LEPGDTVIFSSRVIPGNEKSIFTLYNKLVENQIQVVTDRERFVHVSGHPCREELVQMYQWVRPQIAVPVHGETRHLAAHAQLARACQVPEAIVAENGAMIRLAPGPAEIIDRVHSDRVVLDGSCLRAVDSPVLRQRRKMVVHGALVVTLVVDEVGALLVEPRVAAGGLYDPEDEPEVETAVVEAVKTTLHRLSRRDRAQDGPLGEAARIGVRRALQRELGKKPVVQIQVIRLD
jgi:ribonuclease J